MTSKHVTLLLVPGMGSPGIVYSPLMERLASNSTITSVPFDFPSVDAIATNADLSPNPLEADIAAIRHTLVGLIEEEQKDVFIMTHSYGGTPALCASHGLWAHQRAAKSEAGKQYFRHVLSNVTLPHLTLHRRRPSYPPYELLPVPPFPIHSVRPQHLGLPKPRRRHQR
jgi:hypothetical protein